MRKNWIYNIICLIPCLAFIFINTGCNSTKTLTGDQKLLRSNTINLKSDKVITQKGELKDNLGKLVAQKPNSYFLNIVPFKLLLYNTRYKKYEADTANFQLKSKTVERPVIYDSSLKRRSAVNMKGYLFHQGYFYSQITDTTKFKNKKAYVTYNVEAGTNYLIKDVMLDIDDSTVKAIVKENLDETNLKQGAEFSYTLLENEQSRITAVMKDNGYYKFSNDNISFELDTLNKQYFKDIENPFESAINFIALQKNQKKPTLNIKVIIRAEDDPSAYYRYAINRIRVFPDFESGKDVRDSTMLQMNVDNVAFKYHNYYVKAGVIRKHIFMKPETYYTQKRYDQTISNLNSLGVFQSVRVVFREDTSRPGHWLNCVILLSPAKKYDFNTNIEASSGNTYALGSGLTLSLRNRNFGKGANLLTTAINGNIESQYLDSVGNNVFQHFHLITKTAGINTSLELPKFLIPIAQKSISPQNMPRTVFSIGANLLDRLDYFTLYNISTTFAYRWKETAIKSWEVTPIFVNYIRLPSISAKFDSTLKTNDYLAKTYRDVFIEGENVMFTFSDKEKRSGQNYNYARLSGEEAGGLVTGIGSLLGKTDTLLAHYVKLDFDLQHFFTYRHSMVALRFYGGVGLPYGPSTTLPYIKQYYVGGAYSIRGWRIRTLGPGSYYPTDTTKNSIANQVIDRTGDVKLEMNGEYRFDIAKLFSGAIKMNGALFTDAGNIWLAQKSDGFPNGELNMERFGTDLAVSSGVGLRFDASSFLVMRVDVAMPVKRPGYSYQGGGWTFDEINFSSSEWRRNNLILNIAIGYPF